MKLIILFTLTNCDFRSPKDGEIIQMPGHFLAAADLVSIC